MASLLRIFLCIFVAGVSLYFYVDQQNDMTELRLEIPDLLAELRAVQEENQRLEYEIDRFESPIHLMELLRQPEYSHLKHPYLTDVVQLPVRDQNLLRDKRSEE